MLVEFAAFAHNSNHLLALECEVQKATLFISLKRRTDRWPSRFGHVQNNIMPPMRLQTVSCIAVPETLPSSPKRGSTFQLRAGPSVPGTVAMIFL